MSFSADDASGPLNITGSSAQVTADGGTLDIEDLEVSGDPTVINTSGDVTLSANADSGHTLRFSGQDLAVLASGSINTPAAVNLICAFA